MAVDHDTFNFLLNMFFTHSHAFRKTFQKVIHRNTTLSQARLTIEFLFVRLMKSIRISLSSTMQSHTYTSLGSSHSDVNSEDHSPSSSFSNVTTTLYHLLSLVLQCLTLLCM